MLGPPALQDWAERLDGGGGGPRTWEMCPTRKWGPALLPAPTAPSVGSAKFRVRIPRNPFPTFGSPAQASLSTDPLPPGEEPCGPTRCAGPKASLSFRAARLDRSQNRPMFSGPSWDDPLSRPALRPTTRRPTSAASRDRKIISSGASSRLTSKSPRKNLSLPAAEIGPLVACRTVLPLPAFWRGRDRCPDHLMTMRLSTESRKRNIRVQPCG
jgi:hypothetical protein